MISSVSSAVLCIVQVTHFQLAHTHINLWALPTPDLAVLQHLPHCSAICPGKHSPWDCQSCCVPWQAALTLCRKAWCVAGGCPWCSILLKDSCRAVFSYSHVFWRAHCCTSAQSQLRHFVPGSEQHPGTSGGWQRRLKGHLWKIAALGQFLTSSSWLTPWARWFRFVPNSL